MATDVKAAASLVGPTTPAQKQPVSAQAAQGLLLCEQRCHHFAFITDALYGPCHEVMLMVYCSHQMQRRRKVKVEQTAEDAAAAALALEARLETAGQPAAVFVEGGLAADDEGAAVVQAAPAQPSGSRRKQSEPSDGDAAPAAKPTRRRKAAQSDGDGSGKAARAAGADARSAADDPVQPGTRGVGRVASPKVQ
jgi:hypothetical protein